MDATAGLQPCVPGNRCAFVVPRKLLDGKTTHQVGGRRAPCTSTLHTQQALGHQRQIALPVRLPGGNKYQFGKVGLAAAHQPPTVVQRVIAKHQLGASFQHACAKNLARLCLLHLLVRNRSEEHTSELQSLMRISYAVFCLKKKKKKKKQ